MLQEQKSRAAPAFLAGAAVVLALFGGVFLLMRHSRPAPPEAEPRLPMTAAEQGYASRIHFSDPQMNRVGNFLNQEVTIVFGSLTNDGPRTIRDMEVTLEFRDVFNQVVLRDTRRLPGRRAAPIAPGQRREFQFNYEHVPAGWNHQYPALRITGLLCD